MVEIHRRRLPIAEPCEGFVPQAGTEAGDGGYCERCDKQVHDLSSMPPRKLRRFLARRRGQEVCVSYRTDARGMLRLRAEPRPVLLGALALLLAACAGHLGELELPSTGCVDPEGYEVGCPVVTAEMRTVPAGEAEPEAGDDDPADLDEGEVRDVVVHPPIEIDPSTMTGSPIRGQMVMPVVEAAPGEPEAVEGTDQKVRVNFSVDPEARPLRGVVVIGEWEDRSFVPTAELWHSWKERRARRRAERRRARVAKR